MKIRPTVAIVSYFFLPEPKAAAKRPSQLRRYLEELGWQVRVICPRMQSGTPRQDPAVLEVARGKLGEWLRNIVPADDRPLFEQWTGTSTEGLSQESDPKHSKLLRAARGFILPDQQAPWIAAVLNAALRDEQVRNAQVVLSTAPPFSCHVAGALLAERLKVPLVIDYRDPYSLNSINPPGPLDRPIKERLERSIMQRAAALTAVSKGYARRQAEFGGREVQAIPNGWELEDGRPQQPVAPPSPKDPLVLAHTGTIYPIAHDLKTLLSGIRKASDQGLQLRVRSCGTGGRFLQAGLAEVGLEELLDDIGTVPREQAVEMRAAASAQLLFLPSRPEDEGTIPSKLFDYLITGQPIVAVGDADSEPGQILRQAGAGSAAADAAAVAERLLAIARAQQQGQLASMGVPREAAERFSGQAMAAAFHEVLSELL
ncbi:MAG: hypothetical protein CMP23_02415 [Rickettsiales bacterium]|nr:hypothetical protein [Rickettsiales bacterium]